MVKEVLGDDLMRNYNYDYAAYHINVSGVKLELTENAVRTYCHQYGIDRKDFSQDDINVIEEQLAETAAQLKKKKIPGRLVASDLEISLLENKSDDGVVKILSFVMKDSSPNKN